MEIIKENNVFYIGESLEDAKAKISYEVLDDKTISIDHTWVDSSLQGQGIAKKLMDELIQWAREEKLQVAATCSYAVKQFARDKRYQDVYKNLDITDHEIQS